MAARRPKVAKLVSNPHLRRYVEQRLSGQLTTPDGTVIAGPPPPRFTGNNKPFRKDRAWMWAWSPEQISNRLKLDFPDDESMRISHEAIYQSLYIQGRGALKRELVWSLRTGRALRAPRERSRRKTWAQVTPGTLISERPAEADDRAVPGYWEGDLLIGLERSAIGTVVERTTKFTILVHLPREEGYRHKEAIKNGPALAGYGALTMKNALANSMSTLPETLARSLTWDRGKEMSAHAQFTVETGIPVFFADPHSPWQRGLNENTNGLLRQFFPKGADLSRWSADEIGAHQPALAVLHSHAIHGLRHVSRDIGFCPEAVMKPARWRPRELPGGGHGNCPGGLATDGLAWVYCNGFTPLPESAWVRRTLSPLV